MKQQLLTDVPVTLQRLRNVLQAAIFASSPASVTRRMSSKTSRAAATVSRGTPITSIGVGVGAAGAFLVDLRAVIFFSVG